MHRTSFLHHAAIYGFGTLLLQAAGFLLLPLYTRHLSPAEYGTLEVLQRTAEVLTIGLLFGGLRQATLAFHGQSQDEDQRQQTVASLLVLLALVVLGGLGLTALLAPTWGRWLGIERAEWLQLAIAAALLEASVVVLLAVRQARQESAWYVGITLGQFVLRTGLIVLLVAGAGWGIAGVLWPAVAVGMLFTLLLAAWEWRHGARQPNRRCLRGMLAFAWPLLPTGLCFFILNNGDRFFLLHHAEGTALGTYALGYKLALAVGLLGRTPFALVWSARMYQVARQPDAAIVFGQFFTRLLGVYTFVGLGLCLFQDEVVALVGGPRYADAARILAPVVLAYLFLAAADLMDAGFYVTRRTWHKTWIVALSTACMLLLYALLIPRWAGLGAALATLGGFTLHALLTGTVAQRVFAVRYEPVRLAGMLGLAVGFWLLSRTLPPSAWTLAVKAGLWALWPCSLWVLGLITAEEKEHVRQLVGWRVTFPIFLAGPERLGGVR